MTLQNPPQHQSATHPGAASVIEGSYLDWSAVLAGGVFALAISFLLISFGAGLGLSLTSPYRGEGVSLAWLTIASGIWFVWVMVTGFGAGGYLAGRLRRRVGDAMPDEVAVRDGAHGLMVWAVGALVSTLLAAAGVGGLLTVGANAVGTATDAASEVATSDYFANVMLRRVSESAETAANTVAPAPAAAVDGAAPVIDPRVGDTSPETGNGATSATTPNAQGGPALPDIDPAVQQEVAGILARGATSGEMADRDRAYLAQLVAVNTGLDPEAALARIDAISGEIADARATALDTVEDARVARVVIGFITAATLLVGAIVAFFSATAGGHHRDEGLGLDRLLARQ